MDLIIYALKSVATAIVEPIYLLMLVIIGIVFYLKNTKIAFMQKMTLGESLDSPLELTLSQIVLGIVAGAIGSIILTILGVTFNENSGIEIICTTSIFLYFYKPRFICFSYSGAILGLISLIIIYLSPIIGQQTFLNINILSLVTFIGVFHVIEGILVSLDGSRGAIPVFSTKKEKIVGGFSLNRYWAMPIAIFLIFNNTISEAASVTMQIPNWWPLINKRETLTIIGTAALACLPFYGVVGYSSVAFTKEKRSKALESGILILCYGVSLILVAQLCNIGIVGKLISLIYMPLAHEAMLRYGRRQEVSGNYLYVSDEEGITVLEVAPNSPAFEVGIKRGDKIISINGNRIESETDIFKAAKESIFKIPLEIKKRSGEIIQQTIQPRNKRLGILLVPKMVKSEDIIPVGMDDFKKLLEELKVKK